MVTVFHTGGPNGVQTDQWLDPVLTAAVDPDAAPVVKADGNRYAIGPGAVGDWAGHDGELAEWEDSSASWVFTVPQAGDAVVLIVDVYNPNLAGLALHNGTTWAFWQERLWSSSASLFTNDPFIEEGASFTALADREPGDAGAICMALGNKRRMVAADVRLIDFRNGQPGPGPSYLTKDGHLVLDSTYEVFDDVRASGVAASGPAATQAQVLAYRGAVNLRQWDVGEEAGGNWHMPHTWAPGTQIHPHIHIKLPVATTGVTAKVRFTFSYVIGQDGQTDTAVVSDTKEIDISDLPQYSELWVETFAAINMSGFDESCNISWNLERIAASSDEYGSPIAVAEIDAHFRVQKLGTLTETPGSGP